MSDLSFNNQSPVIYKLLINCRNEAKILFRFNKICLVLNVLFLIFPGIQFAARILLTAPLFQQ